MDIDNDRRPAIYGLSGQFVKPQRAHGSFAMTLDADRLKAQTEASRSAVLANQKIEPKNDNTEDIDFVRQRGIRAYSEEVHRRKRQEMREKIMLAMGLSEETLAEMTPDQRQIIEDMIAQEILQRMAAESMTNGGSENEKDGHGPAAVGDINPGNLLAARVLIGDSGALIGLLANREAEEDVLKPTPSRGRDDDDGIG